MKEREGDASAGFRSLGRAARRRDSEIVNIHFASHSIYADYKITEKIPRHAPIARFNDWIKVIH